LWLHHQLQAAPFAEAPQDGSGECADELRQENEDQALQRPHRLRDQQ
jgi:hypothetical protein